MVKQVKVRVWLAGLVVALGALLVWLDPRGPQDTAIDPEAQAQEPGHVLENAEITLFGENGSVLQALKTPRLIHTPQRSETWTEEPEAILYDSENRQWLASADVGTLNTSTQVLLMSGSARLIAPDEGWQLDTELLHYDGLNQHAWSETPVVLQQPPQQMNASRMDVWLNESQVRLTDNVRGTHPPATQR
ncbi:LPS export ABC transporter periplasmic protein LptC [Vreelandella maris]|uniref:LPS export ABC transporter periplasmic protein LptC n=1 Tax=Vreelandella maris TaxID=2729617 RepID=A0A7Y6RBR4_9GAMM|nr:LPS export ABC transporter periplasmic protein LptC [Halomonas maris]NVF14050.1 LPS export ABC transporter periplasmic protein LptC [Halomonas maris]|tara:strand:- start:525 stop:1094 length:570 start_codon:yes stop_codon:yes gene_type:complete